MCSHASSLTEVLTSQPYL